MFDTVLPSGSRMRYQVLRIAVPREGRGRCPFLQLAYDRDHLPATKSQNQLEQEALLAVVGALPVGLRPVVLADRGFHRAGFIAWLGRHRLDYVVRIKKGGCITETDGRRWKLGEEGLRPGEMRFVEQVRYGLYHGRPRDLRINVASCWRSSKKPGDEPPAQTARGTLVLGHQPRQREERRLLVLAKGLDRAVLQRLKERAASGWRGSGSVRPSAWGGCSWRSPSPSRGSRSCRCPKAAGRCPRALGRR